MFLKNYWYVAARSDEIAAAPFARKILGEPIVFYRTEAGQPVAMENRCRHRAAPLSLGRVTGENIECGYHGMVYAPSGKCVHIPGQAEIPSAAAVKTYPVVERWRFVWIWMGEPAAADESLIPHEFYRRNDDPAWASVGEYIHLKGNWQLLVENLLDLGHLTYVHTRTIGNARVAETPIDMVERADTSVTVGRWIPNYDAPPVYDKVGGFSKRGEKVDRWQVTRYEPPSHCLLNVGVGNVGTVDRNGENIATGGTGGGTRLRMTILNAITPETETTTHYFWATPREFNIDDAEMSGFLKTAFHNTVMEDVAIIEAQQAILDATPGEPLLDIKADKGGLASRLIVEQLAKAERARAGRRNAAE
jgi:vanillate O-demethylase monooxygenase subunit